MFLQTGKLCNFFQITTSKQNRTFDTSNTFVKLELKISSTHFVIFFISGIFFQSHRAIPGSYIPLSSNFWISAGNSPFQSGDKHIYKYVYQHFEMDYSLDFQQRRYLHVSWQEQFCPIYQIFHHSYYWKSEYFTRLTETLI